MKLDYQKIKMLNIVLSGTETTVIFDPHVVIIAGVKLCCISFPNINCQSFLFLLDKIKPRHTMNLQIGNYIYIYIYIND